MEDPDSTAKQRRAAAKRLRKTESPSSSSRRQTTRSQTVPHDGPEGRAESQGVEANIILIAHPRHEHLGTRYRFRPGTTLVIGRAPEADVSLPEVSALSRRHASLTYRIESVILEDLRSTNGTYVNDVRIEEPMLLKSGDRFQAGSVHFKFLQERDVENAYHEAIHEMVVRDGLTQIANKRKFEEESVREVARARRYARPLCVILLDVDNFKTINDTHGHLGGDFVLKEIVRLVSEFVRKEQVFARVGGDEFALLSPEARADGARTLAERLRTRICGHEFSYGGTPFQTTCSFGIAEYGPDMKDAQELYGAADRALYRAKHGGRNAVEVFARP